MYKNRYMESSLLRLSKSFPILYVGGARQVGKTTLLKHLSGNGSGLKHKYVSLDEFDTRSLAMKDPGLFLQQYPAPVIIDEIQYAPQLLPYIKAEVDRTGKNGGYWLTGSQQFHLMRDISESLAGRVGIVKLLGFSQSEENEVPFVSVPFTPAALRPGDVFQPWTVQRIFKSIIRGSFPRLLQRNAPPLDSFYGSYVQTYIDRDLRGLVKVSSLSSFEKFIKVCAARTASILNLSDLARDSDISVNTAKEWLSLLETSGHVFLLQPYYRNISKRLIKAPKLYFIETGLACYLTGWRDARTASLGAQAGALFETFVVSEIIKSHWHRGIEPKIYYFRTKEKHEVDLLIEKDGKLFPVEVKLSSSVRLTDLKGIVQLRKTGYPVGQCAIVAPVREVQLLGGGIFVVPPSAIR